MYSSVVCLLALLSVSTTTLAAAAFTKVDDYTGQKFFENFDFFTDADPTKGFVSYQSLESSVKSSLAAFVPSDIVARSASLSRRSTTTITSTGHRTFRHRRRAAAAAAAASVDTANIFLGVDYTTTIDNSSTTSAGRASTRVTSKKSYNAGSLVVADIAHMPAGICGIWPAFWMVGPNWPTNGEIDIVENVNLHEENKATLHTGGGQACSIAKDVVEKNSSAQVVRLNCDVDAEGQSKNQGCSLVTGNSSVAAVSSNRTTSSSCSSSSSSPKKQQGNAFGTGFNAQGGGVYAVHWTASGIDIYFYPYNLNSNTTTTNNNTNEISSPPNLPSDLLLLNNNNSTTLPSAPTPSTWGQPIASFGGSTCDFSTSFRNLSIVINTSLCGEWAGNTWEADGCAAKTGAASCEEYVAANPAAFEEAYWEVRSLRVFYGS